MNWEDNEIMDIFENVRVGGERERMSRFKEFLLENQKVEFLSEELYAIVEECMIEILENGEDIIDSIWILSELIMRNQWKLDQNRFDQLLGNIMGFSKDIAYKVVYMIFLSTYSVNFLINNESYNVLSKLLINSDIIACYRIIIIIFSASLPNLVTFDFINSVFNVIGGFDSSYQTVLLSCMQRYSKKSEIFINNHQFSMIIDFLHSKQVCLVKSALKLIYQIIRFPQYQHYINEFDLFILLDNLNMRVYIEIFRVVSKIFVRCSGVSHEFCIQCLGTTIMRLYSTHPYMIKSILIEVYLNQNKYDHSEIPKNLNSIIEDALEIFS